MDQFVKLVTSRDFLIAVLAAIAVARWPVCAKMVSWLTRSLKAIMSFGLESDSMARLPTSDSK